MQAAIERPADIRYQGPLGYRAIRLIGFITLTLSQVAGIVLAVGNVTGMAMLNRLLGSLSWVLNWMPALSKLGSVSFILILIAQYAKMRFYPEKLLGSLISSILFAVINYVLVFVALGLVLGMALETAWDMLPVIFQDPDNSMIPEILANVISGLNPDISLLEELPFIPSWLGSLMQNLPDALRRISPESIRFLFKLVPADKLATLMANYKELYMSRVQPELLEWLIRAILNTGNLTIFYDTMVYTALHFFLTYQPKKLKGGKLLLFRGCALIPFVYVVLSIVLMGLVRTGALDLDIDLVGALAHGRPCCYVVVLMMLVYEGVRRADLGAQGLTEAEIGERFLTRRMRLGFSVFIAAAVGVCSLIEGLCSAIPAVSSWGIGKEGVWICLAIPLILLFDIEKKPKNRWPELVMPLYYVLHFAVLGFLMLNIINMALSLMFSIQLF